MREGKHSGDGFNVFHFLTKLKSPPECASVHLILLPGAADPSLWVRGKARPAAQTKPDGCRAASRRGGVSPSEQCFYSHRFAQLVTCRGGWGGGAAFAEDPLSSEGSRWERLLPGRFLLEADAFWPRRASPPPTQTRTSGPSPGGSGGTAAASSANDLVEGEGVVLLPGPLSADSQEVLAPLGAGRSSLGIPPSPAAEGSALLPVEQWRASKFAEAPRHVLWTSVTVFRMFCHRLFQEAVF